MMLRIVKIWRGYIAKDELMKTAGMEDLSNIVRVRRMTLRARCTHLTKWLTKWLTIWLAVDALLATLTLG